MLLAEAIHMYVYVKIMTYRAINNFVPNELLVPDIYNF